MALRELARTVSMNKSKKNCGTTDMFGYFFSKIWREKGHYANMKAYSFPGPTKKGHRPFCPKKA